MDNFEKEWDREFKLEMIKRVCIINIACIVAIGIILLLFYKAGYLGSNNEELPEVIAEPIVESVVEEPPVPETEVKTDGVIIPVVDMVETEEEIEEKIYHISDEEYIAMVVNAEAGNQDEVGQRLVIDVILNRVDSIYFPDTVEAVIFQPSQFTKPAQTYTERQYELVLEEIERRIDKDIIAFRRDEYHKNTKWEDAYVHGAHYFSKFKEEYRENTL